MDEFDLAKMNEVLRHRLRNIASALKGAVSYLGDELEDRLTENEQAYFPLMDKECDHLTDVTDRLSLLFDQVELGFEDTVAEVLTRLNKRLAGRFSESQWSVSGDQEVAACRVRGAKALEVVLDELLSNGLEALGATGTSLACRVEKETLVFEVTNDGCALTEESLPEAFRPFAHARTKHVGVGLTVAKRLIDALGGHISARLPEEGRMTVEVTVPCSIG